MLKKTVDSPCVRNCCLDDNDICIGCGRHLLEIQQWQQSSDEQRLEIVALARQRMQLRLQERKQLRAQPNNSFPQPDS
jgi:predicted Fe-S protein YdhL (DUF1289 family)